MVEGGRTAGGSAFSNVMWNLLQYGGGRLATLVSTIVLARLLVPEDFGTVAVAMLAINLLDRVKDLGVGGALVRDPRPWVHIASTGFTLTAGATVLVSVACCLGAPYLAQALTTGPHVATLTPIIQALSKMLLVSGLTIVPDAALRRRLKFRQRVVPELTGAIIRAVVAIVLGAMGHGAWSLVWGQISGTVAVSLGYWIAYWRGGSITRLLGWSDDVARPLVRYGLSLTFIALLAMVLDNLDYFVIGKRLGPQELGYYTLAFRLPDMLVVGACMVVGQVLFSSFSRLQDDLPQLKRHYLEASGMAALATVPLGLGLAATAAPAVDVMFGSGYEPVIPLLQILGLNSAVYSLSFHAGEVYKATGRTRLMIWLSLSRLAVFAPLLWWAAGYSTLAVAQAFLAGQLLFGVIRLWLVRRVLAISPIEQLGVLWHPLIAGLGMTLVVLLVERLLAGTGSTARVAAEVFVGGLVYLLVVYRLRPDLLRRLVEVFRSRSG